MDACVHTYIYYTHKYACTEILYEYVTMLYLTYYILYVIMGYSGIFSASIMAFSEVLTSFVRNNGRNKKEFSLVIVLFFVDAKLIHCSVN